LLLSMNDVCILDQLWALRGRIEPGDLMVMPMKTTGGGGSAVHTPSPA
jgi:hypothetical protein